jgi:hypothetical protein
MKYRAATSSASRAALGGALEAKMLKVLLTIPLMLADFDHPACSQVGENTKSAQATKNLNIERHRR